MKPPFDQDGKTKTASAIDAGSYPEQDEAREEAESILDLDAIRARAHELWIEHGRPEGTAEEDWAQAEREVRTPLRADLAEHRQLHGSVQR